jgi:hypothetical protein
MSSGSTTTQFYNQLPTKQESGQSRETWKRIFAAIVAPSRIPYSNTPRLRFRFVAKGRPERLQASRPCSHRQSLSAFEQTRLDGIKIATIKIL